MRLTFKYDYDARYEFGFRAVTSVEHAGVSFPFDTVGRTKDEAKGRLIEVVQKFMRTIQNQVLMAQTLAPEEVDVEV